MTQMWFKKIFNFQQPPAPRSHGAVQIVKANDDHTFDLNCEALSKILLSDDVRDKKVVVLSVAGALRKGKSFLLDYLLRFLKNGGLERSSNLIKLKGEERSSDRDWMGGEDDPLTGFSWRGGSERETTGILMWSKPFMATLPESGEEVAILILDTQGAFDNQSTVKDSATIFALSTMISSTQVYNLSMQIQEDDLQYLHLFTEYGRLAMEQGDDIATAPFQSLCFLVRDWYHPHDHTYGMDGGDGYLKKVLRVTDHKREELKLVREHIRSCFESVACFLMPHPGHKVATSLDYDGRLDDIDASFKSYLTQLAPILLSKEKLRVKKIMGTPLTGKGLLECFKIYMEIYQSETLPEPKSILTATAEVNNLTAQVAALDKYNKDMEQICGADTPYLSPDTLEKKHKEYMAAALLEFKSTRKMGDSVFCKQYEDTLVKKMDAAYEYFVNVHRGIIIVPSVKRNESKHILNAYRTPAVLGLIMVLSYLVSSILDMIGVDSLSLLLVVWLYVRYSGNFREVRAMIDNITATVWENVLQLAQRALQQAVTLATDKKTKSNSPHRPHAVQIVKAKDDHTFDLDREALSEILLSDDVRDKKVVVLSVAGAFRKGKSFLLDYLLRFLTNGGLEGSSDWMGRKDNPLAGFSWRGGSKRETAGILMWSKPFIATLPESGEEVAILILDTQGVFDNQSTVKDSATIFALSTMISSTQVYNLSMQIQENDLQHLHLFTEYGRLAMEQGDDIPTPFQSLYFLVRDWPHPHNHPYGMDGGDGYLERVLRVTDHQHDELKLVREHIRSCFESVTCFLMPHPGLKVATSLDSDGRLHDIDESFKSCLTQLAPILLSKDNLRVKKIMGTPLTGKGLLECFKAYMEIYQSETLPEPKSILTATAEVNHLMAQVAALDKYNKDMEERCRDFFLSPDALKNKHNECMEAALLEFRSTRKMGGSVFCKKYKDELVEKMDATHESFVKRNESKRILNDCCKRILNDCLNDLKDCCRVVGILVFILSLPVLMIVMLVLGSD